MNKVIVNDVKKTEPIKALAMIFMSFNGKNTSLFLGVRTMSQNSFHCPFDCFTFLAIFFADLFLFALENEGQTKQQGNFFLARHKRNV